MPVQHAVGLGAKDALMQLASEAVRVAAQSPFLERAVGRATAVLCCVYLPDAGAPAPGASQQGRFRILKHGNFVPAELRLISGGEKAQRGARQSLQMSKKCALFDACCSRCLGALIWAVYCRWQWSGEDRHSHVTQGGASGCRRFSAGMPL